jgi:hypothetical protein
MRKFVEFKFSGLVLLKQRFSKTLKLSEGYGESRCIIKPTFDGEKSIVTKKENE